MVYNIHQMRKDISMSFSYRYYYPWNVNRITKMIVRNNTSTLGLTAPVIVAAAIIIVASIMNLMTGVKAQDDSDDDAIIIAAPASPGVDPNTCVPGNECPPECPEGFVPATPPLNPQLRCVPDTITVNQGVQPGEDERVLQGESADDGTTGGESEDSGSTLFALPANEDASESGDEENDEGEGSDANDDDPPLRFGDGEHGKRPPPSN